MTATPWCKTLSGARSLLACLIATLFTLPAVAQTQTPIFPLPITTTVPAEPGMVTGDFNGDGLPDTAYVSYVSTPTVTVLINQGQGNPPTSIATIGLSCTPQVQLQSGDMNKDGKLDLIVTCSQGYVVVLLGNGDGTFQTPTYYAVANVNAIATPVDLNGDGYLDVVVTTAPAQTNGASSLAVLLNRGGGSPGALASPVIYSAPTSIAFSSISIGDFNGDGKIDILGSGSSFASSQAAVFFGNGDGTLQSAQQITNLTAYETGIGYTVGDFNQDGMADIAYIDSVDNDDQGFSSSTLQILLGNSSGKFTVGSSAALGSALNYQFIVPFHPTATSKVTDLALVGSSTTIALGEGSGNFTVGQSYALTYDQAIYTNLTSNNFPVVPQIGSNGNTNLIFGRSTGANTLVAGNGDGTFQSVPAALLGHGIGPIVAVDLNGDGITDVLSGNSDGSLFAAVGRGNGQFTITSPSSTTGPFAGQSQIVVPGDFNGDGNVDAITIFPGSFNPHGVPLTPPPSASTYRGNGDGTFQVVSEGILLPPLSSPVTAAVSGDFNGDKNLDLIVFYGGAAEGFTYPTATLFFAGHGDNTFAAAVSIQLPLTFGPILVADLNKDGKLDLIYNTTIALGNGDGTFTLQPLGLPGVTTLADLNGDGNLDAVYGASVYAGNGDGTFQITPFYTNPASVTAVGDVNGDGHLDLLAASPTSSANPYLAVYFGDGSGHFTADPNQYPNVVGQLTRLNNQAPLGANDHTLDLLVVGNGVLFSYLNQLNPASSAPAPLPSKTVLTPSATNTAPGVQITLTATVTGAAPTGTVSFITAGKALGTATIINGRATLMASFPTAGTVSVIANYLGDTNNAPSSSSPVSLAVAQVASIVSFGLTTNMPGATEQVTFEANVSGDSPTGVLTFSIVGGPPITTVELSNSGTSFMYAFPAPGTYAVLAQYSGDAANLPSSTTATFTVVPQNFGFSSAGNTATIPAGQSASTTLTIIPEYGYIGTIKFSCSGLTAGESCTFSPSTVTPAVSGLPVSSTFVTSTTAPSSAKLRSIPESLQGIALAGIFCLTLSPRRIWRLRRVMKASLLLLLVAVCFLQLSGCSSSPSGSTSSPGGGTPKGTQTITITAADTAGTLSHTITVQLTVQ
jgi:hypothetical protein